LVISDVIASRLRVALGVREHETLLVLADTPSSETWSTASTESLEEMSERALMARMVCEAIRMGSPHIAAAFTAFPDTGGDGREPPEDVAAAMSASDVALVLTTYSLSHTDARTTACARGARVVTMPGFDAAILRSDGPLTAPLDELTAGASSMSQRLTAANTARLSAPNGTELTFSLQGRGGVGEDGDYARPGAFGNLPAGEAYVAPVEGTAEGRLVVSAGWYPQLADKMVITIRSGRATDIEGGGKVGACLRSMVFPAAHDELPCSRSSVAELGIGVNPRASRPDNVLEAEKIKGTVHVALGDNAHIGGVNESDFHEDFVVPTPTLELDGVSIIVVGEWVV
jgi:leucyl aminopeptidase (aminopeptidase T)